MPPYVANGNPLTNKKSDWCNQIDPLAFTPLPISSVPILEIAGLRPLDLPGYWICGMHIPGYSCVYLMQSHKMSVY